MPTHRLHLAPAGMGNPQVRQFFNVKHNRARHAGRPVALEGLWYLRHALAARVPIAAVFVCPGLLRGEDGLPLVAAALARGAAGFEVSERVLRRMVDRDGPDGLAAIADLAPAALDDIPVRPTTRIVVADRFELAGNLGAIIRCADGAGATALIATDRRLRVTHPLVVKASMGTIFSLPLVETDRDAATAWLRARGFRIVAADPAGSTSYREARYDGPLAIVLGSERYGLDPRWRASADALVSIPMLGTADSLNVGHAAALLLYEALAHHASPPEK